MAEEECALEPWSDTSMTSSDGFVILEDDLPESDDKASSPDSGLELTSESNPYSRFSSPLMSPQSSPDASSKEAFSPSYNNRENDDNLCHSFIKIYESFSREDKDPFDGVDSPRRLYNRRPSNYSNMSGRNRISNLSCQALEFVPKSKPSSPGPFINQMTKSSWPAILSSQLADFQLKFPNAFGMKQEPMDVPIRGQVQNSYPLPPKISLSASSFCRPAITVCVYCQRSGLGEAMYSSHCLRNPILKEIICPILKKDLCKLCDNLEDWRVHRNVECEKQRNVFQNLI